MMDSLPLYQGFLFQIENAHRRGAERNGYGVDQGHGVLTSGSASSPASGS
ncbi:MAG: hypothetical protein QNJ58_08800 [Desulfobacterales bacterium]|nr:hypothetical protein [Desulfobacterales bacterium]